MVTSESCHGAAGTQTTSCVQHGFTLVELLTAIALLAILLSIATPTYRELIDSQNVKAAATALHSAINLTRAEAVKRNASAVLRPAGGETWSKGWLIPAASGASSSDSQPVMRERLKSGVAIESAAASIVFTSNGRLGSAAQEFTISAASGESATALCLGVGLGGQVSVTRGACAEVTQ